MSWSDIGRVVSLRTVKGLSGLHADGMETSGSSGRMRTGSFPAVVRSTVQSRFLDKIRKQISWDTFFEEHWAGNVAHVSQVVSYVSHDFLSLLSPVLYTHPGPMSLLSSISPAPAPVGQLSWAGPGPPAKRSSLGVRMRELSNQYAGIKHTHLMRHFRFRHHLTMIGRGSAGSRED